MVLTASNVCASEKLITHRNQNKDQFQLNEHEEKLRIKNDLTLSLKEELGILKQLSEFELGRFLLINKGLNGYWTSYIIVHGLQKESLHPLEKWILYSAPAFKATQERYSIFNQVLQENLKDNIKIASIPCGVMDDLVNLNINSFNNITFVGIDYDEESIALARENSSSKTGARFILSQQDAWELDIHNEFDVITSNGLNIYEPNENKVIELYKNFYRALKPNGLLITSFLTPPPSVSQESPWKNYNQQDVLKQKAIFGDIIGVHWQAFRTEKQTIDHLEKAGFTSIKLIHDSQGMFPTVIAKK